MLCQMLTISDQMPSKSGQMLSIYLAKRYVCIWPNAEYISSQMLSMYLAKCWVYIWPNAEYVSGQMLSIYLAKC